MSKLYHEEMEDCPCQQGLRCSMNGDFCKEENCAPRFVSGKCLLKTLEKATNPEEEYCLT